MNKLAKPSKPVNLQRANPPEASVQSNKAALAWVECFPGLSQLEAATKSRLLAGSQLLERAVGANVFAPGEASNELFFLLEGTLRVQQTSRSGQEIVLYRVHAGESCVLSNACLFAYQSQTAAGIAETPVRVASIPKQLFDQLLAESATFRDFVLFAFSRRITDLVRAVDEIAFKRLDRRLAEKLLELADAQGVVVTTHQELSVELGSAREVISRQLRVFREKGWVAVARGKVRILNAMALSQLA